MPSEFVELKPEALDRLKGDRRILPKRQVILEYFRVKRGQAGEIEKYLADMKKGIAVPRSFAVTLVECIRDVRKGNDFTLENSFREAMDPEALGIWEDPDTTYHAVGDPHIENSQEYVNSDIDAALMADMLMLTLGRKTAKDGDPMDHESCILRAERLMLRSRTRYAQQIRSLSQSLGLRRAAMFYLYRNKRIGGALTLSLKESPWRAVAAGELNDADLTPDDMSTNSRFFFLQMMSDAEDRNVSVKMKTLAQAKCLLYQTAYFMRKVRPVHPAMLTVISNEHYRTLLMRHGFRPNGNKLKGTDFPLVVRLHKNEGGASNLRSRNVYFQYKLMTCGFIFRNILQWRKEERAR